jgi:hypothetical protein
MLGGAAAWALHLIASVTLAPALCQRGIDWGLWGITLLAVLVALAAMVVAVQDSGLLEELEEAEEGLAVTQALAALPQGFYLSALGLVGVLLSSAAVFVAVC